MTEEEKMRESVCLDVAAHVSRSAREIAKASTAKARETFVYFVQQGDGGPVKIGVAKDPRNRLADLQVGSPYPLRLLCVFRTIVAYESELHRTLRDYRLSGEWFEPHPLILGIAEVLHSVAKYNGHLRELEA